MADMLTAEQQAEIEALEADAARLEGAAKAVELTPFERRKAAAWERAQAAVEAKATAEAERRALDMAARVKAAEAKAPKGCLVAGVDLVALFTAGKSPPADQLPGGGVIIIRNPTAAAVDEVNAEVELKKKPVAAIMAKLLCDCTIDPDSASAAGVTLAEFCRAYPDAATQAATKARELGGAKAREAKRGSA